MRYHIYGIGAALVDTEIEVADSDLYALKVDKGLMTLVHEARQRELIEHLAGHLVASRRASGGSAANTVIAASYFGANTFYTCKVANDDNGHFYLDDLKNAGVNYHKNGELSDGVTGKCLVLITPDAERSMNTFLGISETVSVEDLHPEAIRASDYLYIEGYLATSNTGRPAAVAARRIAEAAGVKTALSLSDPGIVAHFRDGLREMIGNGVDILFCNGAEALDWTGAANIATAADHLTTHAKTFAITLGAEGALIFDGAELHRIEPTPVTAVDTNGAGDMFAGAFLYALSHGYDYPAAGRLACLAAAQVVSEFGPRLRPGQHAKILTAFYRIEAQQRN